MAEVLLVNMPFSNLRWPNIGPSLLKAQLARRGIGCDIAYLNFDFAELVGFDDYYWLSDHFAFVLGGERLFAKHYFNGQLPDDTAYFRDILRRSDPHFSDDDHRHYESFAEVVPGFLDRCLSSIDWSQYKIVGFASSFQQTMPSISVARRIKQLHPEVKIVFGGAACEAEMGIELLRLFPEVDYVFLGEADESFPQVVQQILAGGPVDIPPGVAARGPAGASPPGDVLLNERVKPQFADLDALPYPDFDDYFARLARSPLAARIEPLLFFETSRGCWWGEKHHCTFCGLNGSRLVYRAKKPQRAIDELLYLTQRYQVFNGCSSDNILDYRYFQTFLPMLKQVGLNFGFEFEMKTNMTRAQIETLIGTGMGAAQLGIETLSTPILKGMDKGVTGIQNVQTLKWLSEHNIEIKWNFLYGFPGEDRAEYEKMRAIIPKIYHIAPPIAWGRVRVDRFAPYFNRPEAYGIVNTRPNQAFHYVYPFTREQLARLAYYFEYDYADGRNPLDYVQPVIDEVERWSELFGTVTLRAWDRPDGLLILTDTRPGAASLQRRLGGLDRAIYLFCDTARSFAKILEFVQQQPGEPMSESALRKLLDEWVADSLVLFLDDRYLSLALRAES